jgi:hypothetical protein
VQSRVDVALLNAQEVLRTLPPRNERLIGICGNFEREISTTGSANASPFPPSGQENNTIGSATIVG